MAKPAILTALTAIAKTLPTALKASNSIKQAKAIETQIAKIADKSKLTAADVREVNKLSAKANDILAKGGADKAKINDVKTGIAQKVDDVKSTFTGQPKVTTPKTTAPPAISKATTPKATTPKATTPKATSTKITTTGKTGNVPNPVLAAGAAATGVAAGVGGVLGGKKGVEDPDVITPSTGTTPGAPGAISNSNNGNSNNGNGNNGNGNNGNGTDDTDNDGSGDGSDDGPGAGGFTDSQNWNRLNSVASVVDIKKEPMSDAYALLLATFKQYGLEALVPAIIKMMDEGTGANEAAIKIREEPLYKQRFNGNELRRKAGLNVLTEAEYLDLEDSYQSTLTSYGLGSYYGTNREERWKKLSEVIGSDISAVEFKDRIDTVVTRVENSAPEIKETLKSFYNIGDQDLIGYFLNPKEGLPKLQEKVTAAEIGTEFKKQKLSTDVGSATEFAKLGIDKVAAQKGVAIIADILPESAKLSKIYEEEGVDYTQKIAEEEVFKNLDAARRKRLKLAAKEVGSFSGASGVGQTALKSQNRGIL